MVTALDQRQLLSIVVPCYNEEESFPALRAALALVAAELEKEALRVELVFVDDGSRDGTWGQIAAFAAADARVHGVSLARNFGHQAALTCGYDLARGDAVVCLDADLQDPPELITVLVRKWREGYDVVYAVREHRQGESAFKRWTAACFYRLLRRLGATYVRADCGDFRLMNRASVDALGRLHEYHRFIRGLVGWVGFRTAEVCYQRRPRRAGVTKYPLPKMVRLALDAVVSFSSAPLRLTYWLAGGLMVVVLGYLTYVLINHVMFGGPLLPGWSSLILVITLFGAVNLFCLGLMGEYIGRIYEQVKNRPLYLVRQQLTGGDVATVRTTAQADSPASSSG